MVRFVNKSFMLNRSHNITPIVTRQEEAAPVQVEDKKEEKPVEKVEKKKSASKPKNKKEKNSVDMFTEQKIDAAELVAGKLESEVKVVKKDRGLIERTESSKIILTEDNRQVLND